MSGSPVVKPAPNGLKFIVKAWGSQGFGKPGGLTQFKSNLIAPKFSVTKEHKKIGYKREHYAVVMKTLSEDATHQCYYPGHGDHIWPGLVPVRKGGKTYTYYLHVSKQMSELIKKGEQEHLDDARLAFELTYKLVADIINSLAGNRFGPSSNPTAAYQLAEAEVAKKLPKAFKGNWRSFPGEYARLLNMTETRDKKGWHALANGPLKTLDQQSKIVAEVIKDRTTKIGTVPPKTLIKL